MRRRLCAALVALCASLSLAVPAWAAEFAPDATIADQTFGLPGSSCAGTYAVNLNLSLPHATALASAPAYTLTDGTCTPSTGQTYAACGLPPGLMLSANGDALTGTLAADLKTATAAHYTLTWTVTDNVGPDALTFEIAIVDERPVLEDLYTHTNGDSWTTNTNWSADLSAATCLEDLHGITLQGSTGGNWVGRVTEIRLPNNNLTGSLPESLGAPDHGHDHEDDHAEEEHEDEATLARLQVLDLSGNALTGAMPEGLGNLFSLHTLNLSNNRLTGHIPPDITNAHFLYTLNLSHNQLAGPVPHAVPHEGFTHPGHNEVVDLSHNQLTGTIPWTLGTLMPDLQTLNLSHNNLTGTIPDELTRLLALTTLDLSDNALTGEMPEGLGRQLALTTLDLSHNHLTGEMPATLNQLTSLAGLYLYENRLTGEIPDLSGMTRLSTLNFSHNHLTGEIPATLPTNLLSLYLHHNQLSGAVPALGHLSQLKVLWLHDNHLTTLPPSLPAFSLQSLHLHNNRFSGEISASLTELPFLTSLRLSHNHLTGPIPNITTPTLLTELWLDNNRLTGPIPVLPFLLTTLHLHNNRLEGDLTPLQLLTSLTTLYLHNNRLAGKIPDLSLLSGLSFLSLYGNPWGEPSTLYGYPAELNTRNSLHFVVPKGKETICLYGDAAGAAGATACTTPTQVDQLTVWAPSATELRATWAQPDPAPSGYVVEYATTGWVDTNVQVSVPSPPRIASAHITGLTPGNSYRVRVRPAGGTTPWLLTSITLPASASPPSNPPPSTDGSGGGSGSGGGGSGSGGGGSGSGGGGETRTPADQHGDTPAEATSLNPRRYTTGSISRTIDAHLQSRTDVDYFTLDLPHAGLLTASTTEGDTTGRLYQAQEDGDPLPVAADTTGGPFQLGVPVEPGVYYLAVSAGASFGDYRLAVDYTPAFVENPAPTSPQSGLGLISGWVCAAETVAIELVPARGEPHVLAPAINTSRADTAAACGADTTDTGFGLLVNWNLLGDGPHTVRVVIDDVVFTEREISVTTLGPHPEQEYRRGLRATTAIPDFPAVGETTTLRWAEALQNFVIASGAGGGGGEQLTPEQAWLENPAPGSFQSGLGVISGWVCAAETVEIVFEPGGPAQPLTFEASAGTGGPAQPLAFEAGAGTARADTADTCGASDTGFGVLVNWNLLGDGQHTVRAFADGEEFAHSTVTVTTLGEEFARGLRQTHTIEDFPAPGQTTTVEWQEAQQNFVITAVE